MARLYADENFPFPAVEALRRLGHDVLTMMDTGQAGQGLPDEAVLAFARQEGRAVLTLNRKHFIRLHLAQSDHAGIIVCSYDPDFTRLAGQIDAAIRDESSLQGVLIRINRPAP
ncbi:MAG TPA: hypothetical protein ENK56_08360 [Chloroflexi bacterium]|nr:hypothetical protein [Chloroflexota bacterium]